MASILLTIPIFKAEKLALKILNFLKVNPLRIYWQFIISDHEWMSLDPEMEERATDADHTAEVGREKSFSFFFLDAFLVEFLFSYFLL